MTTIVAMTVSAQQTVDQLEAALAALPPGAKRIKVEGLEAELSISDALLQLSYWRSRAKAELGKRPRISRINLTGS